MCSICGRRFATHHPPLGLGYVQSGMNSFGNSSVYSSLLPIDKYGLSLTVFELLSWLQKRFGPPVRHGYDDRYRSRSYSCFALACVCVTKSAQGAGEMIFRRNAIAFRTIGQASFRSFVRSYVTKCSRRISRKRFDLESSNFMWTSTPTLSTS